MSDLWRVIAMPDEANELVVLRVVVTQKSGTFVLERDARIPIEPRPGDLLELPYDEDPWAEETVREPWFAGLPIKVRRVDREAGRVVVDLDPSGFPDEIDRNGNPLSGWRIAERVR